MDKSDRLKSLLSFGHFPQELPPPFNTVSLGKYRSYILKNWHQNDVPNTYPEIYSTPRIGWKRRSLSIVNPISQFLLSKEISDNWIEIKKHFKKSTASLDMANIEKNSKRAVPKPDFSKIEFMKLKLGGDFGHILISDISRFYGTIYTHALPWALHTKKWCKENVKNSNLKATLGDKLDRLVRKGQGNQTLGIPIGPDTSRILSEIIAVAVEKRFFELSLSNEQLSSPIKEGAYRFVDDWYIGHDSAQAAETAVRFLAQACADFELELNSEKTKIINAKDEIIEFWPSELLDLYISSRNPNNQEKQLNHFFSKAFSLASSNPSSNVMEYALKLARSFQIGRETYPLFESFVLRTARAYPITLPVVVQILVNYRLKGTPLNVPRCKKLILDELERSIPLRHTHEVAWSLFLAKALRIKIEKKWIDPITQVDNSVWALIALDLESNGLVEGDIDKEFWNSLLIKENLTTSNWLLAYEADLKGWLTAADPEFVKEHAWFKVLRSKNISFYDTQKNVETFRNSKIKSSLLARERKKDMNNWLALFFHKTSL